MITRRRGFALIAAIGVLTVLGLIVLALSDSLLAQRQVTRHWRGKADQRLAVDAALRALREAPDTWTGTTTSEVPWGEDTVVVTASVLSADDPIYRHPALTHRVGDRVALVEIKGIRELFLLRGGLRPTRHRLPAELHTFEEGMP